MKCDCGAQSVGSAMHSDWCSTNALLAIEQSIDSWAKTLNELTQLVRELNIDEAKFKQAFEPCLVTTMCDDTEQSQNTAELLVRGLTTVGVPMSEVAQRTKEIQDLLGMPWPEEDEVEWSDS